MAGISDRFGRISEALSRKAVDLDGLDAEELADLQKAVQIAEYLYAKHERKKHVRGLLAELVESIRRSADGIERIDPEMELLGLAAEDHLRRLLEAQGRLGANTSGINLTKSSSAVY